MTAPLAAEQAVRGNTDEALSFVAQYAKATDVKAVCLVAIVPDGPAETRTFDVDDSGALRSWIDQRQGQKNLYLTVNVVKGRPSKKPAKDDIERAVVLFVDIDPPNGVPLAEARRHIDQTAQDLACSPAPPSIVVDSGGGYNLYWLLKSPAPVDGEKGDRTAAIEALGRRLAQRFAGDNVQNVDRILRLPGTINLPNAKKRGEGRPLALAKRITFDAEARYTLDDLRELSVWLLDGLDDITLTPELRGKLTSALMADDKFHARWCGDDKGRRDASRSGWQMSLGTFLKGNGFSKEEALTILNAHPLSASDKLDERQIDRIWDNTATEEGGRKGKKPQREQLLDFRHEMDLWHDATKAGFATILRNGHHEHHRILSREFRGWLVSEHMARGGKAPSSTAIGEALNGLSAYAYSGRQQEPRIRTAEHDGKIYIDLGREDWDAVEIDSDGWRIVPRSPVPLLRPPGMLALPVPARSGNIQALRRFVNVKRDEDFGLLVCFMIAALRPRGPYPILNPVGEGGSAKTTLTRVVRALIDPNTASVTSLPKTEEDLQVDAANGHLLAYDNISHVTPETADALCRLSTGGGLGKRAKYTDSERHVLYACRPIILNGISDVAQRDDLSQRTISLFLPSIADSARKTEADFWGRFSEAAPQIFGALLDGVSHALAHNHEIKAHPPRMADFTIWSMAAIGAYGWNRDAFLEIMREYREEAAAKTAEADAIAHSVQALMRDKPEWQGSLGELLTALENQWSALDTPADRHWPQDVTRLSGRLRRSAPALRVLGIDVNVSDRTGKKNVRVVTIRRVGTEAQERNAA